MAKVLTAVALATAALALTVDESKAQEVGPGGRSFDEVAGKAYVSVAERVWYLQQARARGAILGADARAFLDGQRQAPATQGSTAQVSGTNTHLQRIKMCESGGNYAAVNRIGYYGAYQFDLATWRSVGGSGYPHQAPAWEQDLRAQMLYNQRGSQPWPVCQYS